MKYLDELNDVQKEAVISSEGPVMVVAGAGSGKTRVLTYRIVHLLNKGIDPFNILALTFTNKAAKEMKARVAQIVGGSEAQNLWMGTFHSVFSKILRIEAEKLGYPSNFTIYDTDDSKSLIKTILKELGLDDKIYKPNLVYNRISSAKNNLVSAGAYLNTPEILNEDKLTGKPKIGEIYKIYQSRCFKAGAMDFDDLLFNTNLLLKNFPEALHKYQHKFKYILVDEYQDTNYSQYIIVKKLAALNENICVVGDDAQSIYAFRGATIQNILNFKKDYPDLKTFKLEQNYRSTKIIVDAANSIISKNKNQIQKNVWTENETGEKIKVIKALTDNEEGLMVARSIFEIKSNTQSPCDHFSILYRTNAQSRAMEEALRKLGIPYRIYGGLSFYKRKEIKDVLAYYRLAVNNNDEEALKRVINYPARGIGQTSLDKIIITANESEKSLWYVLSNLNEFNTGVNSGIHSKIMEFINMIKSFSIALNIENAYELGSRIANSSGILKDLYADKSPEGVNRHENIQELLNGLKEFSDNSAPTLLDRPITVEPGSIRRLDEFMEDIALLTDNEESKEDLEEPKVSLMTIHAAKGLEFPYVYVVGLEENLFPSQLSLNSREDLEEERRLFYVALTRACTKAVLSYSTTRYRWGNLVTCEPSRFLDEIDIQYLDAPEKSNYQPDSYSKANNFINKQQVGATNKINKPAQEINASLKKLVNINAATSAPSANFTGDDTKSLQAGMDVEHQRFGSGKVLNIEGAYPNQKATVFFQNIGQKQLLLKFAKLKILN